MNKGQLIKLPKVANPFVDVRVYLGLTVDHVSADLTLHRNSILRTEQGQYDLPPQDLLDYYWTSLSRREEVLTQYQTWRVLMRKANYGLLTYEGPDTSQGPILNSTNALHPFKAWRLYSGVKALNTVAKAFALHQGILFRYESQPERCNTTPVVILDALTDSGYSSQVTDSLETAFQTYKQAIRDSLTVVHHPSSVRRIGLGVS